MFIIIMCNWLNFAHCRGRLPGECEEEVLDMVQDEPTYGSVYYSIQVSQCVSFFWMYLFVVPCTLGKSVVETISVSKLT